MTHRRADGGWVKWVLCACLLQAGAVACTPSGPETAPVEQSDADVDAAVAASHDAVPAAPPPVQPPAVESPPPAGGAGAEPDGPDAQLPTGAPVPPSPSGPEPETEEILPTTLDSPLGELCRSYLRPDVANLVIEIDAQDGAALPPAVVEHLRATLVGVADKPGGIVVDAGGTIPGGGEAWTVDRLRALAAETRSVAPSADTVVVHVLSLRGEPDQNSEIASSIGVAFGGGEFAVFPDRVDSLALLLGGAEAILQAVTVHEAGHLLCLVNLGYTSDIAHEDPEYPRHSSNQGSVMFHAIETTAIGQLFSGPPPRDFDADDLADLEGLRTGRY